MADGFVGQAFSSPGWVMHFQRWNHILPVVALMPEKHLDTEYRLGKPCTLHLDLQDDIWICRSARTAGLLSVLVVCRPSAMSSHVLLPLFTPCAFPFI